MITAEQVHEWSDNQLRVKIAEALGLECKISSGDEWIDDGEPVQVLTSGDIRPLPDWPTDLNAAAELKFDECDIMHGWPHTDEYLNSHNLHWAHISFWNYETEEDQDIHTTAKTEPRARAEAWYLWYLQTKGNQS